MVGKSWDQLDRVPAIRSAILWQYNNNKQQKDKKKNQMFASQWPTLQDIFFNIHTTSITSNVFYVAACPETFRVSCSAYTEIKLEKLTWTKKSNHKLAIQDHVANYE